MRRNIYRNAAAGLGLAVFLALCSYMPGFASEVEKDFAKSLDALAADMHSVSVTVDNSGVKSAAYLRELNGFRALRGAVSQIETKEEARSVMDELHMYGFKADNESEISAFENGMTLLQERIKFLSAAEDPSFAALLPEFKQINKEVNDYRNEVSAVNSSETPKISFSRSTKSKTSRKTSRTLTASSAKLGAHVSNGKTYFGVYSPEATSLTLCLFNKATDKTGKSYEMKKSEDGVWKIVLPGALYGKYYGFKANGKKGDGRLFDPDRLLSDPYAFANYNHDGKSIVVNREYTWKNNNFKRPAAKDAIIYEVHVKDFTAHKSSGVAAAKRGKYLGMLEGKSSKKVLGHLKELGVNVVELMPIHEFDNNFAGVCNHWGYMTSHFFAPECSYASGKKGEGVKELKALIDGLHGEGIAVVLDVVFNHTAEGNEEGIPLNFKGLDNPGYYRLLDSDKSLYWNGTGCGNEMNTQNPMTARMIIDSLKYWVKEYKVDGFRFDLGTIIDKHTMQRIIDELPKNIILTAEPWAADWNRNQWAKSDFRGSRLAKWNDDFRERIRGLANGEVNRNDTMTVLCGSCFWWAGKPAESLNYIEAHDGYTLYDLFKGDMKKLKLSAIALLTAQGMPMLHSGQEYGRSKDGNHNSYDQDNEINYINWSDKAKTKNKQLFDLYKGLIAMRKKYPNFRHSAPLTEDDIQWIKADTDKAIGMVLKGKKDFFVMLNGDGDKWADFKLPGNGDWTVVCNGDEISDSGICTAAGNYRVPPTTGVILRK